MEPREQAVERDETGLAREEGGEPRLQRSAAGWERNDRP